MYFCHIDVTLFQPPPTAATPAGTGISSHVMARAGQAAAPYAQKNAQAIYRCPSTVRGLRNARNSRTDNDRKRPRNMYAAGLTPRGPVAGPRDGDINLHIEGASIVASILAFSVVKVAKSLTVRKEASINAFFYQNVCRYPTPRGASLRPSPRQGGIDFANISIFRLTAKGSDKNLRFSTK